MRTALPQIHQQLAASAIEGGGLAGIAATLSEAVGRCVRVWDHQSRCVTEHPVGGREPPADPTGLPVPKGDITGAWRRGPWWCAAVRWDAERLGAIGLYDPDGGTGEAAHFALEQAATAAGLELFRLSAVAEAEMRMWGDLAVELLLDRNADRVRSHAEALGYDLDRPHRVALVSADLEAAALLHAVFATLRALDVEGIAAAVRGDVGIVVAGEPDWDAFARRLTERVGTAHVGVSASVDNGGKLAGAKRQAEFALRLGLAIGVANVARYDDLGLYRLLAVDGNPVELLRYVDHWLGPLRDYDGQHASSLLRTLAVYLESGGSLDRTAKELFIHRSTLKYRLARISELLGRDLTDPDVRFHLQLATRAVATFGALGARNDTSGADVS